MNAFMALVTMLSAIGGDYEPAPEPEDIDIVDTYARISTKHPELPREAKFAIIELFIERELTDEEKAGLT